MVDRPQVTARSRRLGALAIVVAIGVAIAAAGVVAAVAVWRDELRAWIAGSTPPEAVAFYTCSMDPSVESDHPGACPICGMALTPVTHEDRSSGLVRITAEERQRLGLRVAAVEIRALQAGVVASGTVVEHAGAAGAADRASITARVYRGDPRGVQLGQPAAVGVPDLPLTQLTGTVVAAPWPEAPDELRVEVDNPDQVLRVGTQVDVQVAVELSPRLVVPADAVVYAGARRIVFVDRGHGRFEPRTPKLGVQAAGFVEVIDGLAVGDQVVVEGTFLLAAESRIRSDGALWTDRAPTTIKPRTADRSRP